MFGKIEDAVADHANAHAAASEDTKNSPRTCACTEAEKCRLVVGIDEWRVLSGLRLQDVVDNGQAGCRAGQR